MKKLLFNYLFFFIAISILISSCGEDCDNISVPVGFECKNGVVQEINSGLGVDEVVAPPEITGNVTWTADKIWVLNSKVYVTDGATLTIEPGTIIKGEGGTGANSKALIVARGGKIMAEGTAESPIIMTSIFDDIAVGQNAGTNLSSRQSGLWGGLIILGKAPCSLEGSVTEAQIEGIPADDLNGRYGGDQSDDNSGILNYISVRHGGTLLGGSNEINGITFGGVGSGTTVTNIEVVANLDDGLEFFGGTVNVTNALVWAQGDDAFDVDQAWSGTLDNFINIASSNSDHALEIDGPEGSLVAGFTLKNGTVKGSFAEYADFRDAAIGNVENTYFFNFGENADIELDDNGSSQNYFSGMLNIFNNQFALDTKTIQDISADKADMGDSEAFKIKMAMENSVVAEGENTVGADVSVFNWTYAAALGVLDF